MYKVLLWHYRDGFETDFPTEASRTLYNDADASSIRTILTSTGKDSITDLPTFDFTILPNHPLYDEIVKFKTWITVYKSDRMIFRGRVITDGLDFYGQKSVSCEGALGVLLDSYQDPTSSDKNETPKAHLESIIASHNTEMSRTPNPEPYKCFTVGNVTVDDAETSKKFKKRDSYAQTRSVIDSELLGDYKGYLYVRYENDTLYLDWLKTFNRVNSQPVKMAVNMLDRSIEESADEYYTVLLPVGANKVTIDGKYLEDSTAIAKYGRIYKPESYGNKKKKADLLEEAQKDFAKRGTNLPRSIRVKAVDMFLVGSDVMDLRVGDKLTNVEDRTGALFTDITVAEMTYDILNPANDEYILENQEAIDKRNLSPSKDGTLSGRAGGSADLFSDTKDLYRHYENLTLDVTNNYRLSANAIYEASKYHKILTHVFEMLADEANVITETDNVTTVKFKTFYINNKYGYGDFVRRGDKTYQFIGEYTPGMGWDAAVAAGLVIETAYGESVDVKSIYGTHLHQDAEGTTSVIQDVAGIIVDKVHPEIVDFDEATEYKEGDYVRYDGGVYRCLYNHKGAFNPYHFTFVKEVAKESEIWSYSPVYQTNEQGNEVVNLITGEKEYTVIDGNLEGVPVSNPIKSITRRTQTEFYDVIGQTSTYQSVAQEFDPDAYYTVGQAVKRNGKFYWFVANHHGPWDDTHVEPLREMATVNGEQLYTLTSVFGSTLFHNEEEIDQIVGEVEVVQVKDTDGNVQRRNLVIKNGTGLRAQKDNVEVGIFENGELNAGLLVDSLNNNSGNIAAMQFSQNRSYAVGDYVQYNGVVYRCIVAHNKAAWDSSHFAVATGKIAKLKADIVDLGDYATVSQLDAKTIRVENLFAKTGTLENIYADTVFANEISLDEGGTVYADNFHGSALGYVQAGEIYYGNTDLGDAIISIEEDQNPPSGKIGFKYTTAGGGNGTVNFNIADTATYKAAVGIKSVGAWTWTEDEDTGDGGRYTKTVTANNDETRIIELPFISVNANAGTSQSTFVYAKGPASQDPGLAGKILYAVCDDDYAYIASTSAIGSDTTIYARVPNTKSGGSGTITKIDYSGGDPVYDNNGGYDFKVKASGSNITGAGPYSLHLDATAAVEHGEAIGAASVHPGIQTVNLNGPATGSYADGEDKGTLTANRYYQVVAKPNSGDSVAIKFKTPSSSSSGSSKDIDLQVKAPQRSSPSQGSYTALVRMPTLANNIAIAYARGGTWYIPIEATAPGCTGTKLYVLVIEAV